jgi:hypothetical protein
MHKSQSLADDLRVVAIKSDGIFKFIPANPAYVGPFEELSQDSFQDSGASTG